MTTLKKIESNNELGEHFIQVLNSILQKYTDSFSLILDTNTKLEVYNTVLNNLLYSGKVESSKDKLDIVNLLDEIKIQQENSELNSGKISQSEIEIASKSLGKKSQSSLNK